MIHWQHYYQKHRHLPMQKILEDYQRLVQEFTETRIVLAQTTAGASGGNSEETLPLMYSPDNDELMYWDDGHITLKEFQLIPVGNVTYIEIDLDITEIHNLASYINLTYLYLSAGSLTTVDVSNNINLTDLEIRYNSLTTVDVSNNINLTYLNIQNNNLTTVDVSNNINLTYLDLYSNPLTTVDLSNNINLTVLFMGLNNLTTVDVSNNINLTYLDLYSNPLTTVDLSDNINLRFIDFSNNNLTQLAVDTILIDMAAHESTGNWIYLHGTGNAPRSSASDSAVLYLVSRGWTVATN